MPTFKTGKVTTSAIFYNRGIKSIQQQPFGIYTTINFSILKPMSKFPPDSNIKNIPQLQMKFQ